MPLAANHTGLAATSPSPYFGGGLGTHTSTPTFSDQSSSPFGMRQMTLTPVQKHEKPPVHSASSVPSATAMSSFGRIDRGKFREILDEDGDSSMGGGTLSPCSPSPALHPHCSSPFQQQEDVMMSSIRQEIEDIQKTTSPSPQTTLPPLHEILPGYYNPSPTSSPSFNNNNIFNPLQNQLFLNNDTYLFNNNNNINNNNNNTHNPQALSNKFNNNTTNTHNPQALSNNNISLLNNINHNITTQNLSSKQSNLPKFVISVKLLRPLDGEEDPKEDRHCVTLVG
eukprot:CAMPEP_0201515274 /NCGR_PEP_ID=MMETSP0161_2-20130828/6895_1 /ASSEMBLY_ACC=CAM_ASM_000251 /TAXON_ID=180227 /ORGANISM="Neoparamoeba aestuarina, Strain SoJaBio B1-5/56/2" /LENGTH=281 /DNA_ID=CAMNT_0047912065 /DNA_START=137 /DNA_END=983 /DNA_ORIENTATION=+